MIEIEVPDIEHSVQEVVLGSQRCSLEFNFNSTDQRWRFNLNVEGEKVFSGITVMENQSLLSQYNSSEFLGDLSCIQTQGLPSFVGRDNLGVEKPYGFYYFSATELLQAKGS